MDQLACRLVDLVVSIDKIIAIVKDLTLAGVGISGAMVAWKGLDTWRRQLKGQADYSLARALLLALYRYRDSIHSARNPMIWAQEMVLTPDEMKKIRKDEERFYRLQKAYDARLESVATARGELQVQLLESEALWGSELRDSFKVLLDLESDLRTAVRSELRAHVRPPGGEAEKMEVIEARDAILYRTLNDGPDPFGDKWTNGVRSLENYVRQKLAPP